MNLIYFKARTGNFGDDLNPWIWEKLLGDFESYDNNVDFVGIGSILDERLNKGNQRKVVFGSGIRDFQFICNENVDIRFVRGPISSKYLNNAPYITDSAYCLALLEKNYGNHEKKYNCSIVPYFRHIKNINWKLFEKLTGIHVILPNDTIENILEEINASKKIIAGAMHGAIIADILRVPWKRLRLGKHGYESVLTSEIKWCDWLYSMEIFEEMETLEINDKLFKNSRIASFVSGRIQFLELLKKVNSKGKFYLSSNDVFKEKVNQLKKEVERFIFDYKK